VAWLFAVTAGAQEAEPLPGFLLERLELNPGRGGLVVGGGQLLLKGQLRMSLLGHYQREPLALSPSGQQLLPVRDRVTAVAMGAYGVLPWLEVGAQLPVVVVQDGGELGAQYVVPPASAGVGSPRLSGRVGLLRQASEDAVDLALELGLGLPVGSPRALAREAGPSVTGRVMVGGQWGLVAPALELGMLVRRSVQVGTELGSQDEVGTELRLGAGLTTVGEVLRGELGVLAGFSPGRTNATAEVLGGARFLPVPALEVFALGGVGFGGEPGTPRYRALLGMAFSLEPPPEPVPEPEIVYELVTLKRRATPVGPAEPVVFETVDMTAPPPELPVTSGPASQLGEPDTDGDGVVDVLDVCVRQRGTLEYQGCAPGEPQLVTLTRERLVLNGQVFFGKGSATLPEVSRVLDRVAQVLLEHPEISLVIEGHTDAEGGPTYNQVLSKARAEAVRRYLIDSGVPGERLVAQGFGATRPMTANTTEQGREQNRRVEVLLMLGHSTPVLTETPLP
jgi:outer membrane protein OmpA-like peptidoglycan-associated protein